MPLRSAVAICLFSAALLTGAPAWSCDMAGPNTHVGLISSVDPNARTLTIIDAQTNAPITFLVSDAMLRSVHKDMRITVHYTKQGNALVAKTLKM